MPEIVSIRDANQHLSRYLERVEQGAELVITRRGKPIARVLPIIEGKRLLTDAQCAARERLRERMNRGYGLGGTRSDGESIHERNRSDGERPIVQPVKRRPDLATLLAGWEPLDEPVSDVDQGLLPLDDIRL